MALPAAAAPALALPAPGAAPAPAQPPFHLAADLDSIDVVASIYMGDETIWPGGFSPARLPDMLHSSLATAGYLVMTRSMPCPGPEAPARAACLTC